MTKVWTGLKSRASYLRRLSVVYADELRLKIVTELFMREMSPAQFHEEYGGGSISRVDHHFRKLVEHRWLRYVRTETGEGRRPGGPRHFYRATELAIFDHETWSLVPYSVRVAISWRTFKQLAERVGEAMRAKTFDARPDSHLSWTPLLLDSLAWDRIGDGLAALFESLFEEQADAQLRIHNSGEKPMLATVALALFESPPRPQQTSVKRSIPRLAQGKKSSMPFSRRVSKVFADPLCMQILAEANLRDMSVPVFHREFGGDTTKNLRRRFKMLEDIGWLRLIDEKTGGRRRGAKEQFYRATGPAIYDNESWADVPDEVKAVHSWTTFVQLSEQVKKAIEAGTFEARIDTHLSWSLLRLDQLGWEKVATQVDALFALILKEKDRAEDRHADSGGELTSATVALAAFESPMDEIKAP